MTFLHNTWYVAAWDHEVPHDALFQRTLLLPGDAGAIRTRRVLDGVISTEQKQASQPAPELQALSSSSTEVHP